MSPSGDEHLRLLVVDDDPDMGDIVCTAVAEMGVEVFRCTDPRDALALMRAERIRTALVDVMMPHLNGMELLPQILEADPSATVLIMSTHYSTAAAVQAIQQGATDYLEKPLAVAMLRDKLAELITQFQLRRRASRLDEEMLETYCYEGIIGRSPQMLDVFSTIRRIGPHFRTVLVSGPSGTGKELIAKALHRVSRQSKGPMVTVNCAAITDTLAESELFGYVRGAFTGAVQDKVGLFEAANNGTVFLDEIGEMALPLQAKLLRVLQNQEVVRVGSAATKKVNVQVVAATNRDLREQVKAAAFREDLFFRLSMVEIELPPLAERREDIPLLQRRLLDDFAATYNKELYGFSRRVQQLFSRYYWPGNVRELQNVIGHAAMMARDTFIDMEDLPGYLVAATPAGIRRDLIPMLEMERRYAAEVLERLGGNKAAAAEVLQISRTTLYKLLEQKELTATSD